MDLFKKPCVIRTFEVTKIVKGYPLTNFKDRIVKLNVQPISSTEVLALPEGIRRNKNIKAFGKVLMKPTDDLTGTIGDWIYYRADGHWYECLGADYWGCTPMGQTEAVFGLISGNVDRSLLMPPDLEAIKKAEEEGAVPE